MNIKRFNKPSIHIAALILIVFAFYAHTFDSGFIFDDYIHQELLRLMKNHEREMNIYYFANSPEEVAQNTKMTALPWWTDSKWRMKYFRPVATLSHLIDYSLWGSNPLPYHINNVIWYAALVVLLYLFYYLFCNHLTMAFCGALVFAIEPCHYLTVLWPANRTDLICATFMIVSFICYIRLFENKRALYRILFILSYSLALLTKETAFLFPILLFAYDWIKHKSLKCIIRYHWKDYLPLLLINAAFLTYYKVYGYGNPLYGEKFLSVYPLAFLKSTCLYLFALFYGIVIANLDPHVFSRYWFVIVLLLLLLFFMLHLIWTQRKQYPEIGLFMLWTFLLLPLIVVPPIHDRHLLIPSIGYAYLAALVIFKFEKKKLALFFITISLFFPLIANSIQAKVYEVAVKSNFTRLYNALDEIVTHKTSQDRLFFLNFPKVTHAGENYMYLDLYFIILHRYPQWKAPVYILSPFDDRVSIQKLDNYRIRISHPIRFYFETNMEKTFSLNRTFSEGEIFLLPDLKITIDEMEGEKVKFLEVEFVKPIDNPHYYFLFFDEGRWQRWYPQEKENPFSKG
jgi:hypothetical protein